MTRVFRLSRVCIIGALISLALMVSDEAFSQPKSSSGRRPSSIGSATLDGRANQQLQAPSNFDPSNSRQITPAGAAFLRSAPPHVGGPPPPPPPPVPIDGSMWILIVAGAALGLYQIRKVSRMGLLDFLK